MKTCSKQQGFAYLWTLMLIAFMGVGLKLTPDEEARLERLIAAQASPESPPEHPPIASGPVSAKTFGQP